MGWNPTTRTTCHDQSEQEFGSFPAKNVILLRVGFARKDLEGLLNGEVRPVQE